MNIGLREKAEAVRSTTQGQCSFADGGNPRQVRGLSGEIWLGLLNQCRQTNRAILEMKAAQNTNNTCQPAVF